MNNVARSILFNVGFIFVIVGAMDLVGWANIPEGVRHFANGWAFASLVAFLGAPLKRTKVTVTKSVSGVTANSSIER